jgi:hypothetical protein
MKTGIIIVKDLALALNLIMLGLMVREFHLAWTYGSAVSGAVVRFH